MKKMLRIMAAALAFVMLAAVPAMASTTIYRDGETGDFYVNWMTHLGDTIYIFSYEGDYITWTRDGGISEVMTMDKGEYGEYVEGQSINIGGLVSGEDALYAMVYTYGEEYDEEEEYFSNWLESAELIKIEPNDEGVLAFTDDVVEMEWDDMVESYDDSEYARDIQYPFIKDDTLVFSTYTDNGTGIGVYDVTTGEGEIAELQLSVESFCQYKDGLIIVSRDYDNFEEPPRLQYFDLETFECEDMGEAPCAEYNNPTGLVYDEENDILYFVLNGCLWAMPQLDIAQAAEVCAISTNAWGSFAAILTSDGDYITGDYETIAVTSTDPADRPEASMTVYTGYNSFLDNAYFAFTTANADVEVVKANSISDITQAMMNRDSTVDVYVLSTSDNGYRAVFERGFMAELNDSEKISALVNELYPALQEIVMKDGVIYGVPVSMFTSGGMSYNPAAFEKIGLSEEDVPTTVMELLQLFQRLPELLAENDEISVFQPYMTQQDVKYSLFQQIIGAYGQCMQKGVVEMSYDTELMHSLLEEFEKIDFAAMGLSEEYDEDYEWIPEEENRVLFETYYDISTQRYVVENVWKPMLMSLDEGMDPVVDAYVDVVFVNPFSENRELAIEYIEMAMDSFEQRFLNETCPNQNVPVKNEYYEENIKYYDEELASMKAEMEKAEDEETRDMWQQQIDEMQTWRDEYTENYAWDVSEESIAFYRQYAPYIWPARAMGLEGEASETYYDQIWQYIEGNITHDEMLKNIDDKLRMMLMEDM